MTAAPPALYGASPVNGRVRRTGAELATFSEAIWDICAEHRPLSARQCYYRAVVARLAAKDTGRSRKNEKRVGRALDSMRENGIRHGYYGPWESASAAYQDAWVAELDNGQGADPDIIRARVCRRLLILPFEWLTDNTRTRFQAGQHGSRDDALADMARLYRRDLWRAQDYHVEVWCESDSIGGVLMGVTDEYGVALLPCRGQSSKRFIFDSARAYRRLGKPVACLYVGDFDPAGLDIGNSVEERLARYGADNVVFTRLAIEPFQVRGMGLEGHGLNPNHPAAVRRRFTDMCDAQGIAREAVEAEAMPPDALRQIVRGAIGSYVDPRQWALELAVEAEERRGLEDLADRGGPPAA